MRILVVSNLFPPAFLGGYEIGASWVCRELRRRGHEILVWSASTLVEGRQSGLRIVPQPRTEPYQWLPSGPCLYGVDVLGGVIFQHYSGERAEVAPVLLDYFRSYSRLRQERKDAIEAFAPELILYFNPACLLDPVFAEIACIPQLKDIPKTALISDDWPLRWNECHPLIFLRRHWQQLAIRPPGYNSSFDAAFQALGDFLDRSGALGFTSTPDYTDAVFTSRHLLKKCQPATLHRIPSRVVHWGLPDLAKYPTRRVSDTPVDRPLRLAFCGQIQAHKGLIRILQAMRLTRRAISLIVLGDDSTDYGRFCRAYAEEWGLAGRVEFTGKLPAADVPQALADRADMLLLPSLNGGKDGFEEPFSIVLLQAMAVGLAVGASKSGGSAEAFEDGVSGRFFDPDDLADLAQLIDELDAHPESVRALASAGRAHVLQNFSIEGTVDQLIDGHPDSKTSTPTLIYAVHNATIDPANSGCVRVTRRLGRLLEDRCAITFAKWRHPWDGLRHLRADEAEVLSRFHGPRFGATSASGADLLKDPILKDRLDGGWLLLPEIMPASVCTDHLAYARAHGLRTAAIFYDAIALLEPDFCNEEIRANHAAYMRKLAECDVVIPISHYSEKCLTDFWREQNVKPARVVTALLPGEFSGTVVPDEVPVLNGTARVLCVSTLEPRKNHLRLLAAMRKLDEMCPDVRFELHLVGNSYSGGQEIQHAVESAMASDDRIKWWRVVDDKKLHELYIQSHFTIYPSLIEGFGLPILESIWHKRPCICSDQGVMMELAVEGGCLATNVRDELCLAQAMTLLATKQDFRRDLTLQAVRRPLKTWEEYAIDVLEILYSSPP